MTRKQFLILFGLSMIVFVLTIVVFMDVWAYFFFTGNQSVSIWYIIALIASAISYGLYGKHIKKKQK